MGLRQGPPGAEHQLLPPEVGDAGTVVATGLADSQVAAAVVSRGMSTA